MTKTPIPNKSASLTDVLVRLFRSAAQALRYVFDRGALLSPEELARARREFYERIALDAEIRRRYPDATLRRLEFEQRAKLHGLAFLPTVALHHVAAFLDYLDDPKSSPAPSPYEVLGFQARNVDGSYNGSMTHPVNRARFMIIHRLAMRDGWHIEDYAAERAAWSAEQWRAYEHEQAEMRKVDTARARSTGYPTARASTHRRSTRHRTGRHP